MLPRFRACSRYEAHFSYGGRGMATEASLLGAAGEHFIMCELLRRGYIAALAPQGVPNTDIVVTDPTGDRLCTIQVKSRRDIGSDGGWHMKAKHEEILGERLFYCFVDFGKSPQDRPAVFVMPSAICAKVLAESHAAWLSNPGKGGHQRKQTPMRRMVPDYESAFRPLANPYPKGWMEPYRDAWHLLGLAKEAE